MKNCIYSEIRKSVKINTVIRHIYMKKNINIVKEEKVYK